MAPTAVPFAFVCCSAVPFGKRDHRNGVKIMVPTAVPFGPSVVPCAVPFGKRDHRGSAGREHFGRSVLVCPLPRSLLAKGTTGGLLDESILAGVFWFVPFRGPFWQKGPQGVRRPRAFWPECFGQALPRSLLAKGTTRGPPAESLAAKCSKNVLNF